MDSLGLVYVAVLLLLGTLGWIICYWHREAYKPSLTALWLSWLEFGTLVSAIFLISSFVSTALRRILGVWLNVTELWNEAEWSLLIDALDQLALLLFFLLIRAKKIWVLPRTWERRHTLGGIFMSALRAFLLLIPLFWISSLVWGGFSSFLAEHFSLPFQLEEQELIRNFYELRSWPMRSIFCLCTLVGAPVVEELLFRYGLYRFLKGKWNASKACWGTSLAFGLMHAHWLSFVPLMGLSIFLIRLYEREKNLLPCVLMHAFFNANTLLLLHLG
ncbi:MAG: CPBP family intramembrane metalloprotease [Puniceicoccales bacterium]|nr:CPBP family intramembrane metalloprotease [Puniceicoccales bacterium]